MGKKNSIFTLSDKLLSKQSLPNSTEHVSRLYKEPPTESPKAQK